MHEYVTVSASSYDPAALATKLTEKSADGWDVVSIVQTGGDVTAFLRRSSGSGTSPVTRRSPCWRILRRTTASSRSPRRRPRPSPTPVPISSWAADPAPESTPEPEPESEPTPEPEPEPVSEPAGWGVAPDHRGRCRSRSDAGTDARARAVVDPMPTTVYTPDPTPARTPEPAAAAAAAPAVPAGWYADPSGRFELRYWDGGAWTEHVARGGQQFTDPPVA